MPYKAHFGLKDLPFALTPDVEFFFPSREHASIIASLEFALRRETGVIKVVGEVGTGKTLLCRMLISKLVNTDAVAYINAPRANAQSIVQAICEEFGVRGARGSNPYTALTRFLVDQHAKGRMAVVVVDEAQHLGKEGLEAVRLVSNLETEKRKLLQIVLFGQTELDELLRAPDLRQLNQRVVFSLTTKPLSVEEACQYIRHRVQISRIDGVAYEIFSPDALELIARTSGGIPRVINILADKSLLVGFAEDAPVVQRKHVVEAIQDSAGLVPLAPRLRASRPWMKAAAAALSLVVVGGVTAWGIARHRHAVPVPSQEMASSAPSTSAAPPAAATASPPVSNAKPDAAQDVPLPIASPPTVQIATSPLPPPPKTAGTRPTTEAPRPPAATAGAAPSETKSPAPAIVAAAGQEGGTAPVRPQAVLAPPAEIPVEPKPATTASTAVPGADSPPGNPAPTETDKPAVAAGPSAPSTDKPASPAKEPPEIASPAPKSDVADAGAKPLPSASSGKPASAPNAAPETKTADAPGPAPSAVPAPPPKPAAEAEIASAHPATTSEGKEAPLGAIQPGLLTVEPSAKAETGPPPAPPMGLDTVAETADTVAPPPSKPAAAAPPAPKPVQEATRESAPAAPEPALLPPVVLPKVAVAPVPPPAASPPPEKSTEIKSSEAKVDEEKISPEKAVPEKMSPAKATEEKHVDLAMAAPPAKPALPAEHPREVRPMQERPLAVGSASETSLATRHGGEAAPHIAPEPAKRPTLLAFAPPPPKPRAPRRAARTGTTAPAAKPPRIAEFQPPAAVAVTVASPPPPPAAPPVDPAVIEAAHPGIYPGADPQSKARALGGAPP